MRTKKLAIMVVAVVVIGVSLAAIVTQIARGPEAERPEPTAVWVCDGCGHEAKARWTSVSADCPRCADGQMVQRVFFRCRRCGTLFEGYQVNWSPMAARAADRRKEADAHKALLPECEMDPLLARRPGGKWMWSECVGDGGVMNQLVCPKCGKGRRDEFDKVLDPQ